MGYTGPQCNWGIWAKNKIISYMGLDQNHFLYGLRSKSFPRYV